MDAGNLDFLFYTIAAPFSIQTHMALYSLCVDPAPLTTRSPFLYDTGVRACRKRALGMESPFSPSPVFTAGAQKAAETVCRPLWRFFAFNAKTMEVLS